jgi:hypothetical protein
LVGYNDYRRDIGGYLDGWYTGIQATNFNSEGQVNNADIQLVKISHWIPWP